VVPIRLRRKQPPFCKFGTPFVWLVRHGLSLAWPQANLQKAWYTPPGMGMEMMQKMMGGGEGNDSIRCSRIRLLPPRKRHQWTPLHPPSCTLCSANGWMERERKYLPSWPSPESIIAKALKLSPESAAYLLARLPVQGKLTLMAQLAEDAESSKAHTNSAAGKV